MSKDEIHQVWDTIKTTEFPDTKQVPAGSEGYWIEVMSVGFDELRRVVESSNPREGLKYFVDQFGKEGAQTDMRWLVAARSQLLPANRRVKPANADGQPILRRAQIIFAELQVRQFLKEPKLLARYYQSVVWFENMFDDLFFPILLGNLYRNMKEDSSDDNYWWYAQNFLLLAHATGRDDLLKDVKPEKLKPRFQQWFKWFRFNGMYLRPAPNSWYWEIDKGEKTRQEGYIPFVLHQELPPLKVRPKYPFPDWKGPKPTTPANYRSME
ncbi:hypothetical protein [Gimesia fumaroli]|uniref:hypothetical protein n=1 Tax=Gimesia fumaroli TaxID=2527976 RepID=UPI0011A45311|nr:hypothetical protein [Gimesia fumaroli]